VISALHVKPDRQKHKLDYLGMLLLAAASVCVVLFSVWGGTTYKWTSPVTIGVGAGSIVLAALFLVAEHYAAEPLIPLRLFRNRSFNLAAAIGAVVGVAMFGAVSYLGFFLQMVDHVSATVSGLLMLPFVGGLLVSSISSGRIVSATGRYKIFPILGTAVGCVGLGLLSRMSVTSTRLENGIYMAVMGFGIGLVMQILILIVQNGAPVRDLGSSTAAANYFRQIGGTVGSGVVGAAFASRLADKARQLLPPGAGSHTTNLQALTPTELQSLPPAVEHALVIAYAYALPPIFLALVPLMGAGFVLSFFVKEVKLRTTLTDSVESPETASAHAPADAAAANAQPIPAAVNAQAVPAAVNGDAVPAGPGAQPSLAAANGFAAQAPPDGPVIFGRVRRGGGRPLEGATVTLIAPSGSQAGRTTSGSDGGYRIGVAKPGAYTLIAMASGHQPYASAVRAGGRPAEVDVTLTGASRLTGTIVSAPQGDPLPDVTLTLADGRGEVVATTTTGEKGQYSIENLVAGAYTLAVSAQSWRPTALTVRIADGEEVLQDVELRSGARVTGAARTGAGTGVPDARVTLLDPDGNVTAIATTDADGGYTFENIGEGEYTVMAAGYPPAASRLRIEAGETHSHDVVLGHPED